MVGKRRYDRKAKKQKTYADEPRKWHLPLSWLRRLNGRESVGVGMSTLAGAGEGLFGKRRFKKGKTICSYVGKIIQLIEAVALDYESAYLWGGEEGDIFLMSND